MKNGKILAKAPSIAGFYGVYTAITKWYSLSYNVRFSGSNTAHTKEDMWTNLKLEIADGYLPMQNLLAMIVTNSSNTYESAV